MIPSVVQVAGVVISPSEVTREDMDTPEKIIALVEAKAQEK